MMKLNIQKSDRKGKKARDQCGSTAGVAVLGFSRSSNLQLACNPIISVSTEILSLKIDFGGKLSKPEQRPSSRRNLPGLPVAKSH